MGMRPGEKTAAGMLGRVLYDKNRRQASAWRPARLIPAAVLTLALLAGALTYTLYGRDHEGPSDSESGQDLAAPVRNVFKMQDMHYIRLSDEQAGAFGFSAAAKEGEIGERITVISEGMDPGMTGLEVYRYLPAGGDAVVAVKQEGLYRLYGFHTFQSYMENRDEDAIRYLELFGIRSSEDIEKIQFYRYGDGNARVLAGEITDAAGKETFYGFYSVLKDSSDLYFNTLYNYGSSPAPEMPQESPGEFYNPSEDSTEQNTASDLPAARANPSNVTTVGGPSSISGSPGRGGDALANAVTIRIVHRSGVFHETEYYRNIGFISTDDAGDAFSAFIGGCIGR